MNHNVALHLTHHARVTPDRLALVTARKLVKDGQQPYERLSFSQMEQRVNQLAHGLAERGIQPGDRVVVMIPMSIDLYILMVALLKMGAVTVFIDPWVGLQQVNRCCGLVAPKMFIGMPVAHLLRLFSANFRHIPQHVWARGGLGRLFSIRSEPYPCYEAGPETPALVTFTTGSSGVPKGANRTHGFLWAQHEALKVELDQRPDDVDLPAFPILLLNNLAGGVTSVLPVMKPDKPSQVNPAVIVRQIQDFGVTTASGSPAYWLPIARWCLASKTTLPTVRAVFTGGAPVPSDLLALLKQILPNGEAYVVYGSTEAEPVSRISGSEVLEETCLKTAQGLGNCVGKPAGETCVKIIRLPQPPDTPIRLGDPGWAEWEVPQGEVGEIIVSGDHVGREYWKNESASQLFKIRDGDRIWHRMGDLGYLDDQGRIWLVGRTHNVVVRAGRALYPIQIEAIANQAPGVQASALVGLPDAQLGEKAVLVVVGDPESARKAVEQAGFPIDQVAERPSLPVDPRHNAKIDYAKLKRDWL